MEGNAELLGAVHVSETRGVRSNGIGDKHTAIAARVDARAPAVAQGLADYVASGETILQEVLLLRLAPLRISAQEQAQGSG
jgi:hypothetical protein